MRFSHYGIILCLAYCSCVSKNGLANDETADTPTDSAASIAYVPSPVQVQKEERSSYEQVCDSVQKIYISQIGVRELTGHNDGKQVEMYLASVGLSKGYPYCAAGVHWALNKAGVKNTINGSATTSFNIKSPVWYQRRMIETPHSADVVSFFYPSMGRIAHTGFYDREINSSIYESVEFNTNDDGSRDGIGVFRKKRSYNSTYAISRWVKQ